MDAGTSRFTVHTQKFGLFVIGFCKYYCFKTSFYFRTCEIWNKLPRLIREIECKSTFKEKVIKTSLEYIGNWKLGTIMVSRHNYGLKLTCMFCNALS